MSGSEGPPRCVGFVVAEVRDTYRALLPTPPAANSAYVCINATRASSSLPQDFVRNLLMVDTDKRMTAKQALEHPWMRNSAKDLAKNDLSFNQEQLRVFNATSKLRAAIKSVRKH